MEQSSPHDPKDIADNKDLAALGYVWVLSLVVLVARRESAFVQYHARQGALLFVCSILVWALPVVGRLFEVLILALCVVGFLNAAQGQWRELPIVGPLARGSFSDLRHSWRDVVAACATLWQRVKRQAASAPVPPEPPTPPSAVSSIMASEPSPPSVPPEPTPPVPPLA